jgi:hypothetical protein
MFLKAGNGNSMGTAQDTLPIWQMELLLPVSPGPCTPSENPIVLLTLRVRKCPHAEREEYSHEARQTVTTPCVKSWTAKS